MPRRAVRAWVGQGVVRSHARNGLFSGAKYLLAQWQGTIELSFRAFGVEKIARVISASCAGATPTGFLASPRPRRSSMARPWASGAAPAGRSPTIISAGPARRRAVSVAPGLAGGARRRHGMADRGSSRCDPHRQRQGVSLAGAAPGGRGIRDRAHSPAGGDAALWRPHRASDWLDDGRGSAVAWRDVQRHCRAWGVPVVRSIGVDLG